MVFPPVDAGWTGSDDPFSEFFLGELAVFYRAVSHSPPYYSGDEMMVTGIPSSINSTCHGYFHIH